MCLVINRIRHLRLKPKIARKDILCYKILKINYYDNSDSVKLVTPFQREPVFSHPDEHCLIADNFEEHPNLVENEFVIHHGIHSYRKNAICRNYGDMVVCAYIPKGAKYWIGKYGEFVSERICFGFE